MSNPGEEDTTPIGHVRELAAYFAEGCKPPSAFRIGTEHEKFGSAARAPARASAAIGPPPPTNRAAYTPCSPASRARGWEEIRDQDQLIGLKKDGESVSLEPAGQFELSGAPLASLHDTRAELDRHFADVHAVGAPLGLGFAPLGFHPTARRADMPFMPKSRYAIMRRYMPLVGHLGLDMMLRTCTVQVNLDFALRGRHGAQAARGPAAAAGRHRPVRQLAVHRGPSQRLPVRRANVWTDTDPDEPASPPSSSRMVSASNATPTGC